MTADFRSLIVVVGLLSTVSAVQVRGAEIDEPREAAEIFVAANGAYDDESWSDAIAGYGRLVERGLARAPVYFNLGNAYLRNGELGRAIASLRRARNLAPRDGDIQANLQFARRSIKDAIAPPEPSPVMSTLFFWHYRLSRSELAAVLLALNLSFWSVATMRNFRPHAESLKWLAVVLLVSLLLVAGSVLSLDYWTRPVAVVVPQEIDALTAPEAGSTVRFKLHAGTEVRVESERDGWIRIGLPDGQQGWVESVWVEQVDR